MIRKTCTGCRQRKPRAKFSRSRATSDGYVSRCKTCRATADQAHYVARDLRTTRKKLRNRRRHERRLARKGEIDAACARRYVGEFGHHAAQRLAAAMIYTAVRDAMKFTSGEFISNLRCGRLHHECQPKHAREWVLSGDNAQIVRSFAWWCAFVSVDPDAVGEQIRRAQANSQLRARIGNDLGSMLLNDSRVA